MATSKFKPRYRTITEQVDPTRYGFEKTEILSSNGKEVIHIFEDSVIRLEIIDSYNHEGELNRRTSFIVTPKKGSIILNRISSFQDIINLITSISGKVLVPKTNVTE